MEYTISKHARERYAERIMEKDNTTEINRFCVEHEEKIITDINKMIEYGTLIYQGKQKKDNRTFNISVFVKDLWIVLCDTASHNVITLYKVDFGLDDDFCSIYIDRMLKKLDTAKAEYEQMQVLLFNENKAYKEKIEDNVAMINEYKGYIKNLEELNNSYRNIIDNNNVNIDIASRNISDIVNALIGKKEF